MHDVKVSIVIPTYNRVNSLLETLDSLFNQTYSADNFEIIVCDDNSRDTTESAVSELMKKHNNLFYVKVISDKKGPAKVRNAGILKSSGEIVGFTDDDCIVAENWIETAINCFKQNDIVGVSGKVKTYGNCNHIKFTIPRRVDVDSGDGSYVTSNVFYKKSCLLEVGLFDADMRYMEDIELGWRVKEKGSIHFEPTLIIHHKIYCASLKNYLKRQSKVEYWVLMYSKHPSKKKEDNLLFGHIYNKSAIYISALLLSIVSLIFNSYLSILFLLISGILFMWIHVIIDKNIISYPLRLMLLPKHVLVDSIRYFVSLKASVKYKCLVLF